MCIRDRKIDFHVYLLDNGSDQDEGLILKSKYEGNECITFIQYDRNLGFTGAHLRVWNELFKEDKSIEHICLLNNDTTVNPIWLSELYNLAIEKKCAMVSAKMLLADNHSRVDNLGHRLLNTGEVLPIGHNGLSREFLEPRENFGPCAGAALYSTEMLRAIGFFDSIFITGYEDAELGLRAIVNGYKSWYCPTSIVYHKGGRSIDKIFNHKYASYIQFAVLYSYLKNASYIDLLFSGSFIIFKYIVLLILAVVSNNRVNIRILREAAFLLIKRIKTIIKYRIRSLFKKRKILTFKSEFFFGYYFYRLYRTVIKRDVTAFEIYKSKKAFGRKVLVIGDALDNQNAGVHYYVSSLLSNLAKSNSILNEYHILRSSKKRHSKNYPFPTIYLPRFLEIIPGLKSLKVFVIIPSMAFFKGFDIIFEPTHFGPFNLPPFIKRATFIHDLTPILYPNLHTVNGWLLHRLFLKRILKKTDIIIANSECTKSDIIEKYPFTRDKTFKNYLGLRDLPKRRKQDASVFKKPFFLFVGTIEPRKNLITLINAFEIFCKDTEGYDLRIVGAKGWKCQDVYDAVANSLFKNSIIMHGYVDDQILDELYANCAAFIYPSIYEGFGLPVLEALAYERICIVSDNSSLKELFSECALLFSTFDSLDLHRIMKKSVGSGSERLRVEHQLRFSQIRMQYSWNRHVKKIDSLLCDI